MEKRDKRLEEAYKNVRSVRTFLHLNADVGYLLVDLDTAAKNIKEVMDEATS